MPKGHGHRIPPAQCGPCALPDEEDGRHVRTHKLGSGSQRDRRKTQEDTSRAWTAVPGLGGRRGEFNFYPTRFLAGFVQALGSRYQYSSANQEFASRYWVHGLTFGSQLLELSPDYKHTEMLMAVGWNGMMSHQIPQARRVFTGISKDPDKLLVVIDPRLSETAKIANIHLALRPGTDALLLKAMIAIILREGLHNQEYVDKHVSGFEEILPLFAGFDVNAALKVCELEYDKVFLVCQEFAKRHSCLRDDLGILMNRHSALVSYLLVALLAICGRIGVPEEATSLAKRGTQIRMTPRRGGQRRPTSRPSRGCPLPNVMPEEIANDRPDRLRSVFVDGSESIAVLCRYDRV